MLEPDRSWADGLLPGAETARVLTTFIWGNRLAVKFYYMTTDGFGGKDTLDEAEFLARYPIQIHDHDY